MENELRRRRINLSTLGMGVIWFSVWNILKIMLYVFVSPVQFLPFDLSLEYGGIAKLIFCFLFGIVLLFDFLLRLYIGLCARAESIGRRRSCAYIVAAAVLLVFTAALYINMWFTHTDSRLGNQAAADYYVSLFVDITAMIMLGDLIFTAVRARMLEKRLEG